MRVLVTRPRGREDSLMTRLAERGHEPVHCPLIEVESLGSEPVDVDGYDWVIVTSVAGARELQRRMHGRPRALAAIGGATAEALGGADLVPRVSTQEGLLAELPRPAGRVLFAGAENARRLLVDQLGADFVPLYRTVELRPSHVPEADVAVVASPSAVRALARVASLPVVSIGPETSRAARLAGLQVLAEAERQDVEGLVEAVERATGTR